MTDLVPKLLSGELRVKDSKRFVWVAVLDQDGPARTDTEEQLPTRTNTDGH